MGRGIPLGSGLLGVLLVGYRRQASVRLEHFMDWFHSWGPESLYSAGNGQSSVDVWYVTLLDFKESLDGISGADIYVFVADVLKFLWRSVDFSLVIGSMCQGLLATRWPSDHRCSQEPSQQPGHPVASSQMSSTEALAGSRLMISTLLPSTVVCKTGARRVKRHGDGQFVAPDFCGALGGAPSTGLENMCQESSKK